MLSFHCIRNDSCEEMGKGRGRGANGAKWKKMVNLDTKYVDFLLSFLQHFCQFEITSKLKLEERGGWTHGWIEVTEEMRGNRT